MRWKNEQKKEDSIQFPKIKDTQKCCLLFYMLIIQPPISQVKIHQKQINQIQAIKIIKKYRSEEERKKIRDEILIADGNEDELTDIRYCGHYVHVDCLYRYFSNLCNRHEVNSDYEGRRIISLQNSEFICPSCRRLDTCAVPLL